MVHASEAAAEPLSVAREQGRLWVLTSTEILLLPPPGEPPRVVAAIPHGRLARERIQFLGVYRRNGAPEGWFTVSEGDRMVRILRLVQGEWGWKAEVAFPTAG